jgi:hypothetical protein
MTEYVRTWAFGPRVVMKAASEVVPQTLSSALTCFLRGLSPPLTCFEIPGTV